MKSLWNDSEATQFPGELGLRVYTTRLLGREKTLVLHGGGNTSVKINETNLLGEEEILLYVKGSGWDLEHIEPAGFSPVRLDHLLKLAKLKALSDPQMINEMRTHMTRASAPTPSVEAILHAILPYKYVDHTHADAVLTITNSVDGLARIREIYGDNVVVIPYVMPGYELACSVATHFFTEARKNTIGMVLMHHGLFTFGKTAQESYERMIDLVTWAKNYLVRHKAWTIPVSEEKSVAVPLRMKLASLRSALSAAAGFPVIVTIHDDPASLAFARRLDVATISQQGPATPDHVIRTKRLPMIGRNIQAYVEAYSQYFNELAPTATEPKTMLDPAPRVIIDHEIGVVSVGRSAKDAAIVYDIYSHTIEVIQRATELGGYQALPAKAIFDVEYWDLEQAKLKSGNKPAMFAGEVALVTGAASGIGAASVEALLTRGAAVVGLDINPEIERLYQRLDYLGIVCDVTDEKQLEHALEKTVRKFGGIDMLILNAGLFPPGCRIESLTTVEWHKVLRINLDSNLALMREAHSLLKLSAQGGRVVVIGSKNVAAPGPGAAAYSASKAALNQLARVAALEWGADNIRINSLHPNAVFDTGIWTEEVLQARANHYGLTVDQYKKSNVLKTEVTSRDVAELAAEMCGPLFAKTTAAQVPVDGGNDRVI